MILAILAIWFGYKKARDTGRNGVLWGLICGATFIGVQMMVSLGFGVAIGLGIELLGWSQTLYDDLTWVITIVAIIASIVALLLVFRYLDRTPQPEPVDTPPPPPQFGQDEKDGDI